jgi:hypothetical protein
MAQREREREREIEREIERDWNSSVSQFCITFYVLNLMVNFTLSQILDLDNRVNRRAIRAAFDLDKMSLAHEIPQYFGFSKKYFDYEFCKKFFFSLNSQGPLKPLSFLLNQIQMYSRTRL